MALTQEQREQEIAAFMADNKKLTKERAAEMVASMEADGMYDEPSEYAPWEDPTVTQELGDVAPEQETAPWDDDTVDSEVAPWEDETVEGDIPQEEPEWAPEAVKPAIEYGSQNAPKTLWERLTNNDYVNATVAAQHSPEATQAVVEDAQKYGAMASYNRAQGTDVQEEALTIEETRKVIEDEATKLLEKTYMEGGEMTWDEAVAETSAQMRSEVAQFAADLAMSGVAMPARAAGVLANVAKAVGAGSAIGAAGQTVGNIASNIQSTPEGYELVKGRGIGEDVTSAAILGGLAGGAIPGVSALAGATQRGVSSVLKKGTDVGLEQGASLLRKAGMNDAASVLDEALARSEGLVSDVSIPSKSARQLQQAFDDVQAIEARKAAKVAKADESTQKSISRLSDDYDMQDEWLNSTYKKDMAKLEGDRERALSGAVDPHQQQAINDMYDSKMEELVNTYTKNIDESQAERLVAIDQAGAPASYARYGAHKEAVDTPLFTIDGKAPKEDGSNVLSYGDYTAIRDKMGIVNDLNEEGAMMGLGTVSKQLDEAGKGKRTGAAKAFVEAARSPAEKTAASISGKSKMGAEIFGLRTPGIEKARNNAVNVVADETDNAIDLMQKSLPTRQADKAEEAIDYLKRRLEATKSRDIDTAKTLEKEFDGLRDEWTRKGVTGKTDEMLTEMSRDLKTLRKTAGDIGQDIAESKVAKYLSPTVGGLVGIGEILTTGMSPTLLVKSLGTAAAGHATKTSLNKWVTMSARKRFDEMNKAFEGKLVWDEDTAALLDSGIDYNAAIKYLAMKLALENAVE